MYMIHGDCVDKNDNASFFYLYQETHLKYLVTALSRTPEPSHGDHLDFGVIADREGVIIRTHNTTYEATYNFEFNRSAPECNFIFTEDMVSGVAADDFSKKTMCFESKLPTHYLDYKVPDRVQRDGIYNLCKAMIHGKRALIGMQGGNGLVRLAGRRKNGGRYVVVSGRRRYLRKCPQRAGAGGMTFMNDTFAAFLSRTLFARLPVTPDEITVIFDEYSQLDARGRGNHHIVILYDWDDGPRRIFYLDAAKALTACFVDENPSSPEITREHREMHVAYMQMCRLIYGMSGMSGMSSTSTSTSNTLNSVS